MAADGRPPPAPTEPRRTDGTAVPTRFERDVARKAESRARAQREGDRAIWYSLGLFGVVGWSVALPTLLALALGIWIDGRWPSRVSWTLTLLFVGVVIGCANAWYWVTKESGDD